MHACAQKYHKNQKRYDLYCLWEQNCIFFMSCLYISGIIWQHFYLIFSVFIQLGSMQYNLTMQKVLWNRQKKLQFWKVTLYCLFNTWTKSSFLKFLSTEQWRNIFKIIEVLFCFSTFGVHCRMCHLRVFNDSKNMNLAGLILLCV